MISKKRADLVKLRGYQKYVHGISADYYKQNDEVFEQYQNATGEQKIELRNKLIQMNMPLVIHYIMERYDHFYEANPVYDVDDIVQEGYLILLDAIERYDSSKAKFSPFLYFQLKGRLIYKNTISNAPAHFCFGKTNRYRKVKIYMDLGYDDEYIAKNSDVKLSTIRLLRPFFEGQESYEVLQENLGDDFVTTMQEQDMQTYNLHLCRMMEFPYIVRRNKLLKDALDTLTERDKRLIVKLYGLDGDDPVGFKQLKEEFGYKGSLVYERRRFALKKLAEFPQLEEAFLSVDSDYDYSIDDVVYSLKK